jgi:hypothetical protein
MTQTLIKILFVVGIVNFTLFLISMGLFEGEAINGMIKYGRYYLATRDEHKPYIEVSQTVFTISQLICYSAAITGSVGTVMWTVFGKK